MKSELRLIICSAAPACPALLLAGLTQHTFSYNDTSGYPPGAGIWVGTLVVTAMLIALAVRTTRALIRENAGLVLEAVTNKLAFENGAAGVTVLGVSESQVTECAAKLRRTAQNAWAPVARESSEASHALMAVRELEPRLRSIAAGMVEGMHQTVITTERLLKSVDNTAESSKELSVLANTAERAALDGGARVERMVGTIAAIDAAAQRIAPITDIIDGIAFQTKLLALNAAVEAARAGEQGRGFAVVATEVRRLAQRCAEAAREIRDLICETGEQVKQGVALGEAVGATIADVVAQTARVNQIMSELDLATQHEASLFNKIVSSIQNADRAASVNQDLLATLFTHTRHTVPGTANRTLEMVLSA